MERNGVFKRLKERFLASRRWVIALEFASKKEYASAMKEIDYIEKSIDESPQKPSVFLIELLTLKCLVLLNSGRIADSLISIRRLYRFVEKSESIEGRYIRNYIALLAHSISEHDPRLIADKELNSLLNYQMDRDALDRAPEHLKRKFPLPHSGD
jgi:hypothetical protein